LQITDDAGQPLGTCPLTHTEVEASISGFISRVRVRQTFENPLEQKIAAVYVFPLPQDAAVDHMVMLVGERRIVGQIKPRDEARAIYAAAQAAGHVAGLLDQERPNIFTQSVTNIEPGARVVIELSYVETLRWQDGTYEFMFPMVVGPRFIPGGPTGKQGPGWAPDTSEVPDASKITPPVTPPGTRAGHDISLTVSIDAGMELLDVRSVLHEVQVERRDRARATVSLLNQVTIPNKDFILRYRTASENIGDALFIHEDQRGRFFTLIVQPPRRVPSEHTVPKEILFVIDRSGSMSGFPIEKAKETMRLAINQMHPHDTFNLLSFSGGTGRCFPRPVPNTAHNRAIALQYLADLHGSGGTQMMPAIMEALGGEHDPERVRIVAFMTDGYIGNDFAIIDAVRQHAGTSRVFAFGIGNAVNRFLLDGMAHAGRGAVEYVTLQSQGKGASERFHQRIHSPVLTDIRIDWGSIAVTDVHPQQIPDLFSNQPIVLHGRLTGASDGTIVLRGQSGTGLFERHMRFPVAANAGRHEALASLWARAKVHDLMQHEYAALQRGDVTAQVRDAVTALATEFRLMTQFTSFVAVEELTVTVAGTPRTIAVPVDMPDGVSYQGVFGQTVTRHDRRLSPSLPYAQATAAPRSEVLFKAATSLPREHAEAADREPYRHVATLPKLTAPLPGLRDKVEQEGHQGNLTLGDLRIVDYRIDVMILLHDTSDATLAALKHLGFVQTAESKTTHLLIGTIDVRKLEQLAELEPVLRVTPLSS
jgi:Ca-activated chloride channel family protein